MRLSGSALAALVVTVLLAARGAGQDDEKQDRPKKPNPFEKSPRDSYGDPLPEHARGRLGTMRWRHVGPGPYRAEIGALAFSHDGKVLASLGNGSINLWDRGSGKLVSEFGGRYAGAAPGLAFSADGKRLAASGAPDYIWDSRSGKPLDCRIFRSSDHEEAMALAPNGKSCVVVQGYHLVKCQVPGGKEIGRYKQARAILSYALFSMDGKLVVAGGMRKDRPVVVGWETARDRILFDIEGEPGDFDPNRLALSPDGKTLATGGESLRIWNLAASRQRHQLPKCRAFVLSSTGKVICLTRGGVVLYDATTGKEFARLPEPMHYPNALAISPDGRTLAIGHTKGYIRLVDLQMLSEAMPTTGHRAPVLGLAYAPDGKWLASVSNESIRIWDGGTGEEKRVLPGTAFGLNAVAVAPDGKTIAFGQDHGVQLVSTDTWRPTERFDGAMSVDALAFAPDGKTLLTNVARIDIGAGKGKRYHTQIGNYPSVAFTADGGLVVKGGRPKHGPHLFRPDGKRLPYFDPRMNGGAVAVSPRGGMIAAAEPSSPNVVLFELVSGEARSWLPVNRSADALAFSPDARVLAAGAGDAVVLWDLDAERELHRFKGHAGLVTAVAFAPDGKTLASGGADSTVLLWDIDKMRPRPIRTAAIPPRTLATLWLDLADSDAGVAYRALRQLMHGDDAAVRFLGKRLQPAAGLIDPPLLDHEAPPPALLRRLRALEVLEFIGTVEARRVLVERSRGPLASPVTQAARAALARLTRFSK